MFFYLDKILVIRNKNNSDIKSKIINTQFKTTDVQSV